MGGAGKTALVGHWLDRLAERNYAGAQRVYAWSFHSQGAGEQRQSTAEPFIVAMLRWYGENPAELPLLPIHRARMLVNHIRKEVSSCSTDWNHCNTHPARKKANSKTPGATLLRELAGQNPGICVLTPRVSRWPISPAGAEARCTATRSNAWTLRLALICSLT